MKQQQAFCLIFSCFQPLFFFMLSGCRLLFSVIRLCDIGKLLCGLSARCLPLSYVSSAFVSFSGCMLLQSSLFVIAVIIAVGYYHVVKEVESHYFAGFFQLLCKSVVMRAWLCVVARMVMT